MPKQIIEQTNVNPITEIVLIDATPNSNTKHQREFINSQSHRKLGVLVVVKSLV
jgi:hypothetical protein